MQNLTADMVNASIRQDVLTVIEAAPGQSVKEKIWWAARVLRLPFERVRKYKYNHIGRIDAHEAIAIRLGAEKANQAKRIKLEAELAILNDQRASIGSDLRNNTIKIINRLAGIEDGEI